MNKSWPVSPRELSSSYINERQHSLWVCWNRTDRYFRNKIIFHFSVHFQWTSRNQQKQCSRASKTFIRLIEIKTSLACLSWWSHRGLSRFLYRGCQYRNRHMWKPIFMWFFDRFSFWETCDFLRDLWLFENDIKSSGMRGNIHMKRVTRAVARSEISFKLYEKLKS